MKGEKYIKFDHFTTSNKNKTSKHNKNKMSKVTQMYPYYTMSNKDTTFSSETQQKSKVKSNTNVSILHNVEQRYNFLFRNTTKTKGEK